jgi:hypothetical protein
MPGPCEQSLQSWTKRKNSFLLFVRPLQLVSIQIKFMSRYLLFFQLSNYIHPTASLSFHPCYLIHCLQHNTLCGRFATDQSELGHTAQNSAFRKLGPYREGCGEARHMCLFGGHPNNSESLACSTLCGDLLGGGQGASVRPLLHSLSPALMSCRSMSRRHVLYVPRQHPPRTPSLSTLAIPLSSPSTNLP